MLVPNTIPDKEPHLRVGIVLPEDKFDQIDIEIPNKSGYEIVSDNSTQQIQNTDNFNFQLIDNKISLNTSNTADFWKIVPTEPYEMQSKSGLKVKNVVAGRGFHWEKPINVYLSGSVEIRIFRNYLILINELPIEEYLMCVATSEMGAECPSPLIESQTIAARSWMLADIEQKHIELGMDVCNDDCCQRYQGTGNLTSQSIIGALNTSGQVLIHRDKICDARYSKSCGGMMETFSTIWEGSDPDYLQCIPDAPKDYFHPALPLSDENRVRQWINEIPETFCSSKIVDESTLKKYLGSVDEEGQYFRWQIEYTQQELCDLLNTKLKLSAVEILGFNPIHRGGSGRLSQIETSYRNNNDKYERFIIDSEYKIRRTFHSEFLYSSCFYIQLVDDRNNIPQKFIIRGAGWGHGVGYCQIGALGMALKGYTTEQIVYHYYPGTELKKIY